MFVLETCEPNCTKNRTNLFVSNVSNVCCKARGLSTPYPFHLLLFGIPFDVPLDRGAS